MTHKQVCIIHGGTTFDSYEDYRTSLAAFTPQYERLLYAPNWKTWLVDRLPDYDILLPSMPNKQNAQYDEWAMYFSKIIPLLSPQAILVGHSLGGIFLAKYLSEHKPDAPFAQVILVAAPYSDASAESLGDFALTDASRLVHAAKQIHLFYSTDDPVVNIAEQARYTSDIPTAHVHTFTDKQHFNMGELPELVEVINDQPRS